MMLVVSFVLTSMKSSCTRGSMVMPSKEEVGSSIMIMSKMKDDNGLQNYD